MPVLLSAMAYIYFFKPIKNITFKVYRAIFFNKHALSKNNGLMIFIRYLNYYEIFFFLFTAIS